MRLFNHRKDSLATKIKNSNVMKTGMKITCAIVYRFKAFIKNTSPYRTEEWKWTKAHTHMHTSGVKWRILLIHMVLHMNTVLIVFAEEKMCSIDRAPPFPTRTLPNIRSLKRLHYPEDSCQFAYSLELIKMHCCLFFIFIFSVLERL